MSSYKKYNLDINIKAKSVSKKTKVTIEEYVRLRNIVIQAKSVTISAYSYIRSNSILSSNIEIGRFWRVSPLGMVQS